MSHWKFSKGTVGYSTTKEFGEGAGLGGCKAATVLEGAFEVEEEEEEAGMIFPEMVSV
jgi:hypothetical protein